jgi:hypothetical protein
LLKYCGHQTADVRRWVVRFSSAYSDVTDGPSSQYSDVNCLLGWKISIWKCSTDLNFL